MYSIYTAILDLGFFSYQAFVSFVYCMFCLVYHFDISKYLLERLLKVDRVAPHSSETKHGSNTQTPTPWKMNGWNLQITHLERKMTELNLQGIIYVSAVNLQGCFSTLQNPKQAAPRSQLLASTQAFRMTSDALATAVSKPKVRSKRTTS